MILPQLLWLPNLLVQYSQESNDVIEATVLFEYLQKKSLNIFSLISAQKSLTKISNTHFSEKKKHFSCVFPLTD